MYIIQIRHSLTNLTLIPHIPRINNIRRPRLRLQNLLNKRTFSNKQQFCIITITNRRHISAFLIPQNFLMPKNLVIPFNHYIHLILLLILIRMSMIIQARFRNLDIIQLLQNPHFPLFNYIHPFYLFPFSIYHFILLQIDGNYFVRQPLKIQKHPSIKNRQSSKELYCIRKILCDQGGNYLLKIIALDYEASYICSSFVAVYHTFGINQQHFAYSIPY